MPVHANRLPENPQFTEAQRLVRELLRTAGMEQVRVGQVVIHMADFQAQRIEFQPPSTSVRLHRVE